MPSAKFAAAIGLAALSLSACGTTSKPEAGTRAAAIQSAKGLDDARTTHVACLAQDGIHVQLLQTTVAGQPLPGFRVGTAPGSPTVGFEPTVNAAQGAQIQGEAQGAEVIGAALLFPNQGSDQLLSSVEKCLAIGVKG
jgi:hypothetical protein